jgi:hypothetical protein
MIMNDKLGRMVKEAVTVYFKQLSQHLPAGSEKTTGKFCQNFQPPNQQTNTGTPE